MSLEGETELQDSNNRGGLQVVPKIEQTLLSETGNKKRGTTVRVLGNL